jgi:hypothetical protein
MVSMSKRMNEKVTCKTLHAPKLIMLGGDLDFVKGGSQIGCLNIKLVGDHLQKKKKKKKNFSNIYFSYR